MQRDDATLPLQLEGHTQTVEISLSNCDWANKVSAVVYTKTAIR